MGTVAVERAPAAAGGGVAAALALVGGALLALMTLFFALAGAIEIVARYAGARPLLGPGAYPFVENYLGPGFAVLSLLALPAALAAGFVRDGDPPLRSRSALALVPGTLVALAAGAAALAFLVVWLGQGIETGLTVPLVRIRQAFGGYTFLLFPAIMVLAAVLGGARTAEATAAVAGPAVLLGVFGVLGEASLARLFAAVMLPSLLAALGLAILYTMAPARAVTPWLAGLALAFAMGLLLVTGLFTPTELAALFALFGIVIAVPLRVVAFGQPLGAMLRQSATEFAAIVIVIAAAVVVTFSMALGGGTQEAARAVGAGHGTFIAGAAVYFALCYLLSAALTFALTGPVILTVVQAAQIDAILAGSVATLLGLAAMLARSGRRDPVAAAVSLSPAAAWTAAGILIALAVLVALVPDFALAPVHALL